MGGLLFLLQYSVLWYILLNDYETYKSLNLKWIIALNGLFQSLSAYFTFSFLSNKIDPGYYTGNLLSFSRYIYH